MHITDIWKKGEIPHLTPFKRDNPNWIILFFHFQSYLIHNRLPPLNITPPPLYKGVKGGLRPPYKIELFHSFL